MTDTDDQFMDDLSVLISQYYKGLPGIFETKFEPNFKNVLITNGFLTAEPTGWKITIEYTPGDK